MTSFAISLSPDHTPFSSLSLSILPADVPLSDLGHVINPLSEKALISSLYDLYGLGTVWLH